MGPRPFSRGNYQTTWCVVHVNNGLQWGHDLSAVETTLNSTSPNIPSPLQWGHDLSAVETRLPRAASIDEIKVLQWGHDLSAVETSRKKAQFCSFRLLQWGHDLSAVETSYVVVMVPI